MKQKTFKNLELEKKMENTKYYDTYYGEKVSRYGLENGKVDYACLREAIGGVFYVITHYGTSWGYVLTDIDLREKN